MRLECLCEEIAAAPSSMDVTPTQRMVSACAGVLATSVVVTPMDVVKTRVQAAQAEAVSLHTASTRNGFGGGYQEPCDKCRQQGRPYTTSARAPYTAAMTGMDAAISARVVAAGSAPLVKPPVLPAGTFAALHHIARWEGPRGLYQGLDVSLVMAIPSTVLYYTVYDDLLARLEKAGMGNLVAPATAGSSARLLATVCMAPLELVRTRSQSKKAAVEEAVVGATVRPRGRWASGGASGVGLAGLPLVSVGQDLAKVFREEGASALWRGVGTTMLRDVPFSMVYWLGYENLKTGLGCGRSSGEERYVGGGGEAGARRLAEDRGSADFLVRSFVAGAMSGVVASLLTHPFDVVKTQRQVVLEPVNDLGCEHRPPPPPRQAPGTFDVMRNIVESRGPGGLFTGALARVGKVAPACAIMMLSYEAGKRFFGERNAAAAAAAARGQ